MPDIKEYIEAMRASRSSSSCMLTELLCAETALWPDSEHGFANAPEPFRVSWYAIARGMLSDSTIAFLLKHAVELARSGGMNIGDGQVPKASSQYAYPVTELLLDLLSPLVERATGIALCPTYSFMRIYRRGDLLKAHTDRPACEVTVTLPLGSYPSRHWPLFVRSPQETKQITLSPGDMLVFRGIECMHWRDAFDGAYAAHVFLHYVDQSGPHAALKFDCRSRLND